MDDTLHLPAHTIPAPAHLSARARAMLAPQKPHPPQYPALDDLQGWHTYVQRGNALMLSMFPPLAQDIRSQALHIAGVPVFESQPAQLAGQGRGIVLDLHGGALVLGAGEVAQRMGADAAQRLGRRVWSVDYRMPPAHPYPAALDDALAVYRELLTHHAPQDIVVFGASAGGNLAAALVLRARDEGLPLPAGLILLTPEVDLTESGDSFHTNAQLDAVLNSLMPVNQLYAAGADLRHPYLSPLFGDFRQGFVPTLLTAGTRDLFLSNAVRMHRALRRADIPAELHLLDAASHTGFGGAPEAEEITLELRKFLAAWLDHASAQPAASVEAAVAA